MKRIEVLLGQFMRYLPHRHEPLFLMRARIENESRQALRLHTRIM